MAYAATADMVARYGADDLVRLTDRAGALNAIDEAVLGVALDDASAEINGYLAKRYVLPLDPAPRILTVLACQIAYYILLGDRAGEQPAKVYEAAKTFLRAVGRGELSLGDETPAETAAASPGPVIEEGPDRLFTRDSLRGF